MAGGLEIVNSQKLYAYLLGRAEHCILKTSSTRIGNSNFWYTLLMSNKICINGHHFEKTSSCPVCPFCSTEEMKEKYGDNFPKIGAPAFRALESIGITHLSQLTKYCEKELLALHGFGPKALRLLKEKLTEKGLSLLAK